MMKNSDEDSVPMDFTGSLTPWFYVTGDTRNGNATKKEGGEYPEAKSHIFMEIIDLPIQIIFMFFSLVPPTNVLECSKGSLCHCSDHHLICLSFCHGGRKPLDSSVLVTRLALQIAL